MNWSLRAEKKIGQIEISGRKECLGNGVGEVRRCWAVCHAVHGCDRT